MAAPSHARGVRGALLLPTLLLAGCVHAPDPAAPGAPLAMHVGAICSGTCMPGGFIALVFSDGQAVAYSADPHGAHDPAAQAAARRYHAPGWDEAIRAEGMGPDNATRFQTGRVDPSALARLRDAIRDARDATPPTKGAGCADCGGDGLTLWRDGHAARIYVPPYASDDPAAKTADTRSAEALLDAWRGTMATFTT